MTFTASFPDPPEMSLKARLTWEYFFGKSCGGWACARTSDGVWITTDEACDLDNARIYPDDESFVSWLESVADDHIDDDRVEWFRNFTKIPELVDNDVALAMERLL